MVALARSGLATLFALMAALLFRTPLVCFRPRILWIRSISGSCSMVAAFYALTHMPASEVLTITNTFPVWVAILSWPLAREKPTPSVAIAIACSILGIAIALQPGGSDFSWPPAICALTASFFTAVAMLGLNRLAGVAPLAVVVHFSAVSTLFCGATFLLFEIEPEANREISTNSLFKLLAVGLTATVGQFFLTRAYAQGSPTKVSIVGLTQVVMVMICETILGWKQVTMANFLGTMLVLGPTAWLMSRERRPPKAENETQLEEVAIE